MRRTPHPLDAMRTEMLRAKLPGWITGTGLAQTNTTQWREVQRSAGGIRWSSLPRNGVPAKTRCEAGDSTAVWRRYRTIFATILEPIGGQAA